MSFPKYIFSFRLIKLTCFCSSDFWPGTKVGKVIPKCNFGHCSIHTTYTHLASTKRKMQESTHYFPLIIGKSSPNIAISLLVSEIIIFFFSQCTVIRWLFFWHLVSEHLGANLTFYSDSLEFFWTSVTFLKI